MLAEVLHVERDDVVIDVGCGSGILGIIAAKLGASRVHATDASPDVIAVGRQNAASHGVADRITFYQGDLFDPIPDDVVADVIIGDVSGIPDPIARESGWFPSGRGGGPHGSELPIRMLEAAKRRLKAGGRVLLPTGSLQDEAAILRTARSIYGAMRKLAERVIPLPATLRETEALQELVEAGVVALTPRGSRLVWEARVWECELGRTG
jgi:precorrin-6B methylase 2